MKLRDLEPQRLSTWLTGAIVLLAAVIVWELGWSSAPSVSDDAFRQISTAIPELEKGNFALPHQEAFAEIIDRPLFSNTRRPFVAVTEPRQRQISVVAPPVWDLIGTVITPGKRSALFLSQMSGLFLQLEIGMSSEGWELADVSTDTATLVRGERSHEIRLAQ